MPLRGRHNDIAVSIREMGSDIRRSGALRLSRREIQVAELVLRGHRKVTLPPRWVSLRHQKHLSRIFEKVGVNSRLSLSESSPGLILVTF